MPPAGRVPGCSRPRRGPLFHQATPTSTAAAPGSNEGANMRQQGCSCFHLYRANSWARVPGQQHYKFCNKCRVNIAREATGRAVPGHPCSLDSWAGSWMLAATQPAPPRLQDPTSNTTRRAGSWMLTASARAALLSGDTNQHRRGSSILQDPTRATGLQPLLFIQGHQLAP